VLLSCLRPPGEAPGLSRRLVDRCHGGVCAAIDIPGRPSRVKLLKQFAAEQQVLLPVEVIECLAESGPQIPRELQGLVTRLAQLAAQRTAIIDVGLVAGLLRQEPQQQTGRMAEIAREVARQFGVALRVLRSQSRNAGNVVPRQAAMYLSRELTGAPYAEIGRYFDGRNHSTVVHACQRFETLLQHDPRVASLVENVRDRLPSPAGCRKPVRQRATRTREAG
jgi:chromosomal replication initiator protein